MLGNKMINFNDLPAKDKIYYQDESVAIYCSDNRQVLPLFPDKSFDLVLTDPPYGTTNCEWDIDIELPELWKILLRIVESDCALIFTGSQPFTTDLINSNRAIFRYEWIWEKSMPSNFALANKQPMKYHENILVFYSQQPTYNKIMLERSDVGKERLRNNGSVLSGTKQSNHISTNICNNGERRFYDPNLVNPKSVLHFGSEPNCNGTKLHPTQKPIELFEYLIQVYSNPTTIILDPFLGSGTTAVAAKILGRKCIGIEISEKYCEIAAKRLSQSVMQLEIPKEDVKTETML